MSDLESDPQQSETFVCVRVSGWTASASRVKRLPHVFSRMCAGLYFVFEESLYEAEEKDKSKNRARTQSPCRNTCCLQYNMIYNTLN